MWLHNAGADDLGEVRLRCSDLLAHDGTRCQFRCECGSIPPSFRCRPVEPRNHHEIEVAARRSIPAIYRGTLLVEGHPELWLPVILTVQLVGLVTSIADRPTWSPGSRTDCAKWRRSVRRSMLDAMPDGEPVQWLYGPMREYPSRPGKALRPALCLSAGRAFGAEPMTCSASRWQSSCCTTPFSSTMTSPTAARCVGAGPTLAATYGMAAALNAGDGLAIVAGQVLRRATRRLDRDLADLVWREFDTMALRTLEGQATEVGWQLDNVEDLRPEDYLELIMHKTCWYTTIHPLRVGAIVGSRGTAELGPLVRFGFHFGAAFQIRDDLLNLVGDERTYGKEILGDLYEGKRTLPLVHLMANATGADRRVGP